ncbi:MAG: Asparagine synthase [Parcubacteria group bacterium GW2011_GWC2_45_7]|nr:MAG: Asparagine synthase [Parcubacteria group bacterium GW2011_GWC2_45_7]
MHSFVAVKNQYCAVELENHYSGYGNVRTKADKVIYIKGAPRLYQRNSISGIAQDEVFKEEGNEKSAPLVQELLKERDSNKWGNYLAGNFFIIVKDDANSQCHIITDLGNSFHLYQSRFIDGSGIAFSTDVDRLALITGRNDDVDYTSIAEYMINVSMTYPYTAYLGIKEVSYASCIRITHDREVFASEFQYWQPSCRNNEGSSDIQGLSQELRKGILNASEGILDGKKNVGLFLSGGIDSRALAGLMAHFEIKGKGITVTDVENTESGIAREVAKVNGLEHELFLRDPEYYPHVVGSYIGLEGPHSTFTRAVHLGFLDSIKSYGFDAVLGGYMSDTLLKLHEANVTGKIFLGRHLGPLEKFDPTDSTYLRGGKEYIKRFSFLFKPDILDEVIKRRKETMEYWNNLREDGSAWEWSWMWPFSRNQHNANLTTNIFNYSSFEVFTDRSVIEIARVASQKIKINGKLFNKAMWTFLRKTAHIPNAVTQLPLFRSSWLNEIIITAKHLPPRRWMFKAPLEMCASNPIATYGSWPDLARLWGASGVLKELRSEYDAFDLEKEIMFPHIKSVFDFDLYSGLSKRHVQHIMYTMLHFDQWNKRRISLCHDYAAKR